MFPVKNGLKQGDVLSPFLFNLNRKFLALNCNLCVIPYFIQIVRKFEYTLLLGQNRSLGTTPVVI